LVADIRVVEKRAVEVDRQAACLFERNTAKMLGIDGSWDVVGDNRTSAACAHDDNVARESVRFAARNASDLICSPGTH
jgi:hypothetical protein